MGYNKTKAVEAAQKYLNQGRISQAIAEYEQILRHDPRDQVTLMTIGDLYVRQGETFQALDYFERLAQLFLNDGFVAKAIAIYKKVAKLAPEESRPLERLAELYVQQGVMSEARPLYLQLAETHLRANRHQQAVGLLRKLLEVEPDNLRVHARLGELYQAIGQGHEAAETYLDCAQRVLDRAQYGEAEKLADRALGIAPANARALTIKARALASAGKRADAIQLLESQAGSDTASPTTALLAEQYLQAGESGRAAVLARKVFQESKDYELASKVVQGLLDAGETDRAIELLGEIREPMLEAGAHDRLAQALTAAADRAPGRLEPREWLAELYTRTHDSFHLTEALTHLADAALAAGQLERAKQAYEQLLDRDPEDEPNRQRLNQVRAQLGLEPVKKAAVPKAAVAEAELDEDTQRYVNQALVEVDLFSSYGMTQQALNLLETVLKRAPQHTVALEKLLDLHLSAGNDRGTAELAARLEQIYAGRGDAANAERFSELRRRFQRAAGLAAEDLTAPAAQPVRPAEFPLPAAESELAEEVQPVPAGEPMVHEVDLSEEWAALARQMEGTTPIPAENVTPTEVREAAAVEPDEPATAPAAIPSEPAVKPAPEYQFELPSAASQGSSVMSSDQFLAELATEFEGLKLDSALRGAPAAAEPAGPVPVPENKLTAEPLREVFDVFRAELGEIGAEDEDLETHYNLGIAYREMGLLEEAIGEFQNVAKANDKGRAFRYAMQCCTLLGLAFMEKGQPEIAALWYQRALGTPGLDQESILALRYDLGVAQELAGDVEGALKSFSQVYAMNIDYRDVAERIAALDEQQR